MNFEPYGGSFAHPSNLSFPHEGENHNKSLKKKKKAFSLLTLRSGLSAVSNALVVLCPLALRKNQGGRAKESHQ